MEKFRNREGKRWDVFAPPRFTGDTMFRALVQIDPPKEKTAGGLHKAETYQTPSTEGVVLDMSHGGYGLERGTRVMVGNYSGIPLGDDVGDRLKIVNYEEIVMVEPKE